ncbi:MAG: ABC transporter ATP-binding protein [Firmicutes bacterium]|nr:ABC transporter ATP-binding protein [Bacillota bacterium]
MPEQAIKDALVKVDDLTIRFRINRHGRRSYIEPVSHVSFCIAPSEVLALVGESGSGKTTIGRALLKIVEPAEGRLYFDGREITHLTPHAIRQLHADVQLIFQDPFGALNPTATIQDHLVLPLTVYRHVGRHDMDERVRRLLEQVGLVPAEEIRFKYPHELSGGQRQRVVIARALAVEPRFIVADEPVSMLDVSIRAEILKILNDLKGRLGISLLYITHDLASARYLSDRIMVLYGGKVMEVGEANDITLNPRHPYTQLLLAAVPGPTEATTLPQVSEATPDLHVGRKGCPFAPRCPYAMEACHAQTPSLLTIEGEHWAACHLVHSP